jgi:hypothetical protein
VKKGLFVRPDEGIELHAKWYFSCSAGSGRKAIMICKKAPCSAIAIAISLLRRG